MAAPYFPYTTHDVLIDPAGPLLGTVLQCQLCSWVEGPLFHIAKPSDLARAHQRQAHSPHCLEEDCIEPVGREGGRCRVHHIASVGKQNLTTQGRGRPKLNPEDYPPCPCGAPVAVYSSGRCMRCYSRERSRRRRGVA